MTPVPHPIGKEMPSHGSPFSPAEVERDQVLEFHLNHVIATASPSELCLTRWVDLSAEQKVQAVVHSGQQYVRQLELA